VQEVLSIFKERDSARNIKLLKQELAQYRKAKKNYLFSFSKAVN
jgi:hypothetical protein